jgi:hypothetical protein
MSDDSIVPATSLPDRISRAIVLAWRPTPVAPPVLDSHLEDLSGIERVAEVLRFNALTVENAISPLGGFRAWLKLNVLVALVLAVGWFLYLVKVPSRNSKQPPARSCEHGRDGPCRSHWRPRRYGFDYPAR